MGAMITSAITILLAAAPAPQDALVFGARTGIVLNFVKADRVESFEVALADLHRALKGSGNPVRAQQAEGWRFFKAAEPGPGGSSIFVFVVDPVLPGADYSLQTVFDEAFPSDEARQAYQRFADSLASPQAIFNLALIADMKPPPQKPALRRRR